MGAEADQVAEKERELMNVQLESARQRMLNAMRLGDTGLMSRLAAEIEELEHQMKLH
jgi:hypothetical protein